MSGGTFNVDRDVWTHPFFAPAPFSEREAFLWLVSEASWKPRQVRAGRVVANLERGQLCASMAFMADAWGWKKSRVQRYIGRLRDASMIDTDTDTGQLVVTVCNYEKFQAPRYAGDTGAIRERYASDTNENKGNKGKKDKRESARERAPSYASVLSDFVSAETARQFVEHRQKAKAPLGEGAVKQITGHLSKIRDAGGDPDEALLMAMDRGWRTIKPDWFWREKQKDAAPRRESNGRRESRADQTERMFAAFDEIDRRVAAGADRGDDGPADDGWRACPDGHGNVVTFLDARPVGPGARDCDEAMGHGAFHAPGMGRGGGFR